MPDVYGIYIRVSTEKQSEHGDSIEMQRELGEKIIKDNDGVLYKIYYENAVSASKTKLKDREVLMECLKDAKAGYFNKLIAYRRDRLSRKAEDSLAIRSMLESAKCELIFSATGEMQMMLNDPYGKLMENIRASLDEIESATIAMRVSDVMRSKAERGEVSGGNLSYGYERINDEVRLIPEQVPIIKEIEDMYLSGLGLHSIAKWLNGGEVKSLGFRPGGRVERSHKQHKRCSDFWTRDVIESILFSRFYCGYVEYSKEGERRSQKDKAKIISVKGNHETLRSEERQQLIDSKRNKKKQNITAPRHYQTQFLLTGLLFCGECGEKFISRNSTKKGGKPYLYYVCSSKRANGQAHTCKNNQYKKETLELYTIQNIKEYIKTLNIDSLSHRIHQQLSSSETDDKKELMEIEKRIIKLEKSKNAIKRLLFELDEDDDNYDLLKQEYQNDQTTIIKEINEIHRIKDNIELGLQTRKTQKVSYEDVIANLKNFLQMFDRLPQVSQKVLLDSLIDKIEIFESGELRCHFSIDTDYKMEEEIEVSFGVLGGVGDKTTVVLAPLVAAAGVPVAKMSGRGLGHTGGTLDKLESISGFSVEMGREQFFAQVGEIGAAVIGQSGNITPADKKLYALRDVTATVESIPLIASSVMSKKIAAGADAIVLDVKTGSGAFMKTLDDSIALAQAMVDIGTHLGRNTVAVISDMDQPLGFGIGNALEIKEGIETLKGQGPKDLQEVCLILGSQMLVLGGKAKDEVEARSILLSHIEDGSALEKFKQMVSAQGGDVTQVEAPDTLPSAGRFLEVKAASAGYVESIQAEEIGVAAMLLGAGRETKESQIDLAVGIQLSLKVGDTVAAGDTLAVLHVNDASESKVQEAEAKVLEAYRISADPVPPQPLVFALVTKDGVTRY